MYKQSQKTSKNIKRTILISEAMIANKWIWFSFGGNVGQSDPIEIEHVVPPSEGIEQVSNWYIKSCWKKLENQDEQTDGRRGGHCHGIIRPFFKQAYKKVKDQDGQSMWFIPVSKYCVLDI